MSTATLDYFSLLELPRSCQIDAQLLEKNYRQLQSHWHPDRFAGAAASEQKVAVQRTSLINDAYTTLLSPLRRAAHLLLLNEVDVGAFSQDQLEPAFLLMQMDIRDELEESVQAEDMSALEALQGKVTEQQTKMWQDLCQHIENLQWEEAKRQYYKLQFASRFLEEIKIAEDRLLGY